MKKIAIANQKGGVGKSTLARHLYFYVMEELGLRALALDLDPQGNFSKTVRAYRKRVFDLDDEGDYLTALDLFDADQGEKKPMPIGNGSGLISAGRELVDVGGKPLEALTMPRDVLASLEGDFDVLIIDTAPTLGNPLYAALIAADFVVCPCTMDEDAIEGLTELYDDIRRVKSLEEWNPDLVPLGVIANIVKNDRSFERASLTNLREELGEIVFESVLFDRAATHYTKDRPVWKSVKGVESRTVAAGEMRAACAEVFRKAAIA